MCDFAETYPDFEIVQQLATQIHWFHNCILRDKIMEEYALIGMTKPIDVSEYKIVESIHSELKTCLPTVERQETELEEHLKRTNRKKRG